MYTKMSVAISLLKQLLMAQVLISATMVCLFTASLQSSLRILVSVLSYQAVLSIFWLKPWCFF